MQIWDKWMDEEIRIIRHVINGDVESFGLLVQRYQRPVISMINHIINDSHTSEDVAQDVFLTAYKKLASFDSARSRFSTWLFTIARNKALNALKKKRPLVPKGLPERTDFSNPGEESAQREFFDKLDQTLEELPKGQKTAFILAEFEKLSYQEIAQIEGVRIGTVKSRINRAKKKLRMVFKDSKADTR